jgi:hypothetical protein
VAIHAAGAVHPYRPGHLGNRLISGALEGVAQESKARRRYAAPLRRAGVFPACRSPSDGGRGDEPARPHVRPHGEIYENERAPPSGATGCSGDRHLVMGVMVGALILSMLLAITSINDVVT